MLATFVFFLHQLSQPVITVDLGRLTTEVSQDLYGVFFEEINNAGDGGIYAELLRNTKFAEPGFFSGWKKQGDIDITKSQTGVEVTASNQSKIINEGFYGISAEKGKKYKLVLDAIALGEPITLRVKLRDTKGLILAESTIWVNKQGIPNTVFLMPSQTSRDAHLEIEFKNRDKGKVRINFVSLFPTQTFKNRENGLRPDLVHMVKDLNPAFVRFPGGCWVEGDVCATSYRWKTTIGPVPNRATVPNLWNYVSGNGLGYHEYLQMCEDIGSSALFVVNCGMSHKEVIPMDKMDEYVQDALDAIEYANGSESSIWGRKRAENGHPKPFNLRYIEIGNENGGPDYAARFPFFVRAIKSRYPEIKLITNVWGGVPTTAPVDIVDEHYYSNPEFFIQNFNKYDSYDRKGPKVYVGEYAVTQGCGNGNLQAALAEAVFMMGMEKNSDIVTMSSYAPLFANVKNKAWNPDLIYFDNYRSCGTPSYYVQKLFAKYRPSRNVQTHVTGVFEETPKFSPGGVGIGTWSTQAEFRDIKVESGGKTLYNSETSTELKFESGKWTLKDGVYRQDSFQEGARAWIGDQTWKSYTLTCKARKLGGAEGFLITVGRANDKDFVWWNIGGWGNQLSAIENSVGGGKSLVGKQVQTQVESGKWYDVRVDYSPERITCTLEGKVMYSEKLHPTKKLFAIGGVNATGDAIVKIVNISKNPITTNLKLTGLANDSAQATASTLSRANPLDENTLDIPRKIFPVESKLKFKNGATKISLGAHSLTIVRVQSKSKQR